MGYRWSFTQKRFVKTGALSLATIPANASIILNGDEQKTHTPILIRNLTPGNYEIVLQKDGYLNWQKTLAIESEKTAFAINVTLFKNSQPMAIQNLSTLARLPDHSLLPSRFKQFSVFHDKKLDTIVVINNGTQSRVTQLNGNRAVWRQVPIALLFAYSPHEVWQFNPKDQRNTLITRLLEEIKIVIPIPKQESLLLILNDRVRAIELDKRDRQNSWDLAQFDKIKNAVLSEDSKTLFIEGSRDGKEGVWSLELY
ncbi:hypothetical protein A3B21_03115 [Candidatus Uhrbacteria bacterium RIFCSPLOWO2_01_FULL_47_24]|uniref:PEGA domain-containing protein n=1 Tax=Candidatus Uhrbacteria bacterium RIFCSPLOWO2_01_FULL_47_24 TaxID=1802401 RepID=A0A1F7URL7_9BACT|nr:MAG: hypothetical protein A3D58_03715 [Candidatus Uhrbacteria bacterium RIFCSPHIGHO2_02_FULL_46_47]OGL80931.1 MAG: hypothetical protein A3B21_03115 [Candidatus Uhrbacteria bacterium RIFCSPLOWO2_01_FULL_47_24]